ncbi:hypothetical protein N431DRAFT_442059 [Stipitochalara longipes BDJ]|nr:hypothetical protein N431DRAFT_442059 [Stipitochalara longipes BDJ]
MKLQLFILLSTLSALSLQTPVPQTTTTLSSTTNLPVSAASSVSPTIKLFGDETQGDSMASSLSSSLTSAIANPESYFKNNINAVLIIGGMVAILSGFLVVLVVGYRKRKARMLAGQNGGEEQGYAGNQGRGYGGNQAQSYGVDGGKAAEGKNYEGDEESYEGKGEVDEEAEEAEEGEERKD